MLFARNRLLKLSRLFCTPKGLEFAESVPKARSSSRSAKQSFAGKIGVVSRINSRRSEADTLEHESDIAPILSRLRRDTANRDEQKAILELSGFCSRLIELHSAEGPARFYLSKTVETELEPIFDFFFQVEIIDATFLAILMDNLSTLIDKGYNLLKVELKSMIFFQKNAESVVKSIFLASNTRLAYEFLTSVSRIARSRLKLSPEIRATIVAVRTRLVQETLKHPLKDLGSWSESGRLVRAIVNSRDIGVAPTSEEENYLSENAYEILRDGPTHFEHFIVLVALAKTNSLPLDKCEVLDNNFIQCKRSANFKISTFFVVDREVIEWLCSIQQMEKLFPKSNQLIMNLFEPALVNNYELLEKALRELPLEKGGLQVIFFNRLIEKMFAEEKSNGQDFESLAFLRFASLAVFKLSRIGEFANYKSRDKLCTKFTKGLLATADLEPLIESASIFINAQNIARMSDTIEVERVIKRLHEWKLQNPNAVGPKKCQLMVYNILKTEIANPDKYIAPFAAPVISKFRSMGSSGELYQETKVMTLIASAVYWVFRSRLKASPADPARDSQLHDYLDLCHTIFADASKAKVDLGVHIVHQYALLCDLCVLCNVYDGDQQMTSKLQATADKLVGLLAKVAIKSTNLADGFTFMSRNSSNEDLFQSILEQLQIPFEREKRIRVFDVDFFLPSLNTVVELDGLIHFTRSSKLELTKTVMKREYFKLLGYRVFTFSSFVKSKNDDMKAQMETELNLLLKASQDPNNQTEQLPPKKKRVRVAKTES